MFFNLSILSFGSVMKTVAILLLCLLGIFTQGTLVHANFPNIIVPDFSLLLVIYLGLRYQALRGLLASFCLGLLLDFASATYLGPHAAGCVIAFCVTGIIAKRVFAEKTFAIASITFWSCLVKSSTYAFLLILYVSGDLLSFTSLQRVLLEAIFTAVVAPIVFKLFMSKQPKSHFSNSLSFSSSRKS